MSFDVWIVGFGLSRVLSEQTPGAAILGYGVWAVAVVLDTYLLLRFFRGRGTRGTPVAGVTRHMETVP